MAERFEAAARLSALANECMTRVKSRAMFDPRDLIAALDAARIEYVVIGGFAVAATATFGRRRISTSSRRQHPTTSNASLVCCGISTPELYATGDFDAAEFPVDPLDPSSWPRAATSSCRRVGATGHDAVGPWHRGRVPRTSSSRVRDLDHGLGPCGLHLLQGRPHHHEASRRSPVGPGRPQPSRRLMTRSRDMRVPADPVGRRAPARGHGCDCPPLAPRAALWTRRRSRAPNESARMREKQRSLRAPPATR